MRERERGREGELWSADICWLVRSKRRSERMHDERVSAVQEKGTELSEGEERRKEGER